MYNNRFYGPYYQTVKPRFFDNLRNLKFSDILNGTQKTLNIINQAIPIIYQIKPLWNNSKTIFNIAKAVNTNEEKPVPIKKEEKTNTPVFFL